MPHDNIIPLSSKDTINEFLKFAHEKLMEIMPSFPQIPPTLIQKPFENQVNLSEKIGEIKTYFSSDENAGKIDDYIEQLGLSDLTGALKNTNKQSAASYQFIVDNFLSVNGLLRLYVQQLEGDAVTAASDKIKLEEQYAEELDAVTEASRFELFSENAETYNKGLVNLIGLCQTQLQQTTTENVAYDKARQSFIEIFKSGNPGLGEAIIQALEKSKNITDDWLRYKIDFFQSCSQLSNQLSPGASNWNNSEPKTQSEPVQYNGAVDDLKKISTNYNENFKEAVQNALKKYTVPFFGSKSQKFWTKFSEVLTQESKQHYNWGAYETAGLMSWGKKKYSMSALIEEHLGTNKRDQFKDVELADIDAMLRPLFEKQSAFVESKSSQKSAKQQITEYEEERDKLISSILTFLPVIKKLQIPVLESKIECIADFSQVRGWNDVEKKASEAPRLEKTLSSSYEGTLGAHSLYPPMENETIHQAKTKETEENAQLLLEAHKLLAFFETQQNAEHNLLAEKLDSAHRVLEGIKERRENGTLTLSVDFLQGQIDSLHEFRESGARVFQTKQEDTVVSLVREFNLIIGNFDKDITDLEGIKQKLDSAVKAVPGWVMKENTEAHKAAMQGQCIIAKAITSLRKLHLRAKASQSRLNKLKGPCEHGEYVKKHALCKNFETELSTFKHSYRNRRNAIALNCRSNLDKLKTQRDSQTMRKVFEAIRYCLTAVMTLFIKPVRSRYSKTKGALQTGLTLFASNEVGGTSYQGCSCSYQPVSAG